MYITNPDSISFDDEKEIKALKNMARHVLTLKHYIAGIDTEEQKRMIDLAEKISALQVRFEELEYG